MNPIRSSSISSNIDNSKYFETSSNYDAMFVSHSQSLDRYKFKYESFCSVYHYNIEYRIN